MIIQHPSTPEDMRNPQEVVEQCMAEFFPYLLEIVMDYGFDAYDKRFQDELRVLIEFARAILLKQKGVSHELQVVFEENGILNTEDTEE
tara:strand:+ start:105 stop:371 length:267 start_codon:yes stop_codon:yes gene_type:complete